MYRKAITAWITTITIVFSTIGISASTIPTPRVTRMYPNKLTVSWCDSRRIPVTIDTFRVFGYNLAQLRTMVSVLGGTIEHRSDGSYQIMVTGTTTPFEPINFKEQQDIEYRLNNTLIRDIRGQICTLSQPGWVYLPRYEYNWGSFRDVAHAMGVEIISFNDDPVKGITEVVVGPCPDPGNHSGWEDPKPPGRSPVLPYIPPTPEPSITLTPIPTITPTPTSAPTQIPTPTSIPTPTPVEPDVDFDAQYIRTNGFHTNITYPIITIISSKNELAQYYEKYKDMYNFADPYDESISFLDAVKRYTDDFFIDNYLVIILHEETSGSIRHKVERVDKNGDIVISRLIPYMQTTDMAEWNIIVELKNSFEPSQFNVVFIDVEEIQQVGAYVEAFKSFYKHHSSGYIAIDLSNVQYDKYLIRSEIENYLVAEGSHVTLLWDDMDGLIESGYAVRNDNCIIFNNGSFLSFDDSGYLSQGVADMILSEIGKTLSETLLVIYINHWFSPDNTATAIHGTIYIVEKTADTWTTIYDDIYLLGDCWVNDPE